MITKGIITKIPSGKWYNDKGEEEYDNLYEVNIPIFISAGQNKETTTKVNNVKATLCYQPENLNSYRVGDVVFIGFENNNMSNPIILGKLYMGLKDDNSYNYSINETLKVLKSAKLPNDTTFGDIALEDIAKLFRQFYNLVDSGIYEHNITIGDGQTFEESTNIVTFKLVCSQKEEFTSASDIAKILFDRGLTYKNNCLNASGGRDGALIYGVFGDIDYDLNVAYYLSNDTTKAYSDVIIVSYLNDTPVKIL